MPKERVGYAEVSVFLYHHHHHHHHNCFFSSRGSNNTMAVSSPSSTSSVQQFLNTVLSQTGPNALPYNEDVKLLIRQHLLSLLHHFPSLRVKPAPFTHNNGTSLYLLHAHGTFPMPYHGITYNIPVSLWLLEAYPKIAPRVFLTPTRDMVIKRPHPHVDASGLVSVPYLQNWVFPRSNLVELVRSLGITFGQDPPLYSKPAAAAPHSQRTSSVQSAGSPAAHPFPAAAASPLRPTQTQLPPSPQRASRTENPSDVFKRNAVNTLMERFKKDLFEVRMTRETEMDNLMTVQAQLKEREEILKKGVQDMEREKEGLEQQLQVILTNTDVLQNWLRMNGKPNLEFDIDDVFEPCDQLSKQMLECTSADLAVEDVLYSLDKAVQEGSIPVDVYLKHVRNLAREQFFHRAISAKIETAKLRMQVPSMATRYVV